MIGRTISHYKILEKIGEGGMGVVYKAEDVMLKRTVALKFLPPEALRDETEKTRFMHEAQAEAALDHPNICAIHEIEKAEGQIFIAMAHIEGQSLKQRIESAPLKLDEALDIAIQIAEGLQEAHEKGITHRDIKPGNVMLTTKNQAKIMDFGLAKLTDTTKITKSQTTLGTLAYMSPEQVKGENVDRQTDIWSLGVVLYELLTRQQPFGGEYEAAVLYSIVNEAHISTMKINKSIPSELEDVVGKALQKKVENRYHSMQEMLCDLKQIQQCMSTGVVRPIGIVGKRAQWGPLRKTAIIFAAALIAVIVLFIIVKGPDIFNRIIPAPIVDVEPVWIALMDFENDTREPALGYIFKNLLSTDLDQSRYVRIVKSSSFQALSEEKGDGSIDLSPALEWCRNRKVPILISGNIEQKEDSFLVVTNVFDVEAGKSLYNKHVPYADKEDIFAVVDEVSKGIKANPKIVPQGGEEVDLEISRLMSNSFDALLDFCTGTETYKSGDPATGIRKVHNAVKLDSTFVIALHCLALHYDHSHDSQRAIEYAQRASKLVEGMGPEQEIFSYYIECTVKKEWHKANNYLNTLLKIKPDKNIEWYLRKGYITVHHIKNYKETISHLEKAIELDAINLSGRLGECYNFLGYAYLYSGQPNKAYEAFDKYQDWIGPMPDPLHTKGSAFQFSGQYERAIEQYEKVLREDPSYHMCYKDLGWTYLEIGKCREALRNFEKYLELQGESDPYGHVLLGNFYYMQENALMAEREVSKALELDSLSIQAHWLQGIISLELNNDIESARKELRTLKRVTKDIGVSGETAYYHHLRGLILLSTGDIDEGLKSLREAEEISPADFTYFGKELVQGYYAAGLYRDAIMKADSLLNTYFVERNNGELQYLIGLAYQEENKQEEANQCFHKAQQIWKDADPDFRPLIILTSKLEESL